MYMYVHDTGTCNNMLVRVSKTGLRSIVQISEISGIAYYMKKVLFNYMYTSDAALCLYDVFFNYNVDILRKRL